MWSIGEDQPERTAQQPRVECPGCGAPDLHGDDFCHECGHGFEHFGWGHLGGAGAMPSTRCPVCVTGELLELEYGRSQCDACGYTPRDEG